MASSAPPPPRAPVGELLAGRYQLERRIGQGGMAEVWVATDTDLDRRVAVKWLKTNLASDPVVTERFRREAIAVARLNHPNIVGVHDVVAHEGRQAVVMQLVDGKSLRQLLDSQKRLGPELTIHIGAAIAGALDEAHRNGFVHRDVKPGNILVTSDGRVLLTDFGIAKGLQPGDEVDLTQRQHHDGNGQVPVTRAGARATKLDGRADLYSLGLVLYECLAGRVPFLGQTDADTALARLQRDPTDLATPAGQRCRSGLVSIIHQLARPEPRPPAGQTVPRRPHALRARRRRARRHRSTAHRHRAGSLGIRQSTDVITRRPGQGPGANQATHTPTGNPFRSPCVRLTPQRRTRPHRRFRASTGADTGRRRTGRRDATPPLGTPQRWPPSPRASSADKR